MEKNFDRKEVKDFLKLLSTAKDEVSIESYIYIKNILNSIVFAVPFTIYSKGTKFFRSRVHKDDEDLFESIDDLSYRKDLQNIKTFGRSNEPGQSVFYCTNNVITSFAETTPIVRNDIEKDFEYTTTGIWIAKENISVVNLLTNEETKGQHVEFDECCKDFENLIDAQNDESGFAVRDLLQFLSKEFSTVVKENSNHYKITSAFTNYVFDTIENVDGILYPSTIHKTEGFNFALKTDSVDKKLQFYGAERIKMKNVGFHKYQEVELIRSDVTTDSNVIKWIR